MVKSFFKLFDFLKQKQIIDANDISNSTVIQVNINSKLESSDFKEITDILSSKEQVKVNDDYDNSIISDLLEKHIKYVKKLFNDRNMLLLDIELNSIINATNFNLLPTTVQAEYLYLLGNLYIEKNECDLAKAILKRLRDFDLDNYCNDLNFKIICKECDYEEFNLFIQKIEALVSPEKIILYKSFFHLNNNEFKEVLNLLWADEKIIESLKKDSNYYYYLGLAHYYLNNQELALKFLNKSDKVLPTPIKKLLAIINIISPILNQPYISIEETYKNNQEIFDNCLDKLLTLESSISNDVNEVQVNYYQYLLTLYLYIEPKKVFEKINQLQDGLIHEPVFLFYLAEMHFILKEYKQAYEKYKNFIKETEESNIEIQERYFICMWKIENYDEIIHIFDSKLKSMEMIESSTVFELYLNSLFKISENEFMARSKIFIGTKFENWLYYLVVGKLSKDDYSINKAISLVNKTSLTDTYYLSKNLYVMNKKLEALNVLEFTKNINQDILIFYLEIGLSIGDTDSVHKFLNLVKNPPITLPENTQNKFFAEFYFLLHDYIYSCEYFEKIWISDINEQNERNAYQILICKLNNLDTNNIDLYLNKLNESKNPHHLMICGLTYRKLKNDINNSLKLFYRAINLLNGDVDLTVYKNYVELFFPISDTPIPDIIDLSNNISEVNADCIITVSNTSTNNSHRIFIHNEHDDIPLIKQNITDEHIIVGSAEESFLRGRRVNQKFISNQQEYEILNIENKYLNLFINTRDILFEADLPNSFFKSYNVDPENISATLDEFKKLLPSPSQYKKLLNDYMRGESPLIVLAEFNYSKYPHLLQYLLDDPRYSLKSGINNSIKNNKNIVLSISSLVLLELNGLLSKLNGTNLNIYIPKSIEIFLEQQFKNLLLGKRAATMFIDEANNLRFQESPQELHDMEVELWRNLLTFVKQNNIIKIFKKTVSNISYIDLDLDSLNLAIAYNAVYITEDSCFKTIPVKMEISNSISLIDYCFEHQLVTFSEYISLIKKFNENNYEYVFSESQLLQIASYLLNDLPLYDGISLNLIHFKNLLDSYLKHKKIFIIFIPAMVNLIRYLKDNSSNKNFVPLMYTIYDSLIDASVKHFNNRYALLLSLSSKLQ